jgi:lysophospholipase L1-like esterase
MLAVGGATGCGDAVAKAKTATVAPMPLALQFEGRSPEALPQVLEPSKRFANNLEGVVEHPEALRQVFAQLAQLEGGASRQDVRILQFGDSHTAADFETGTIREVLQSRFGDGGRGFVALGAPYKGYVQEGIHAGMSADWTGINAKFAKGKRRSHDDGLYGLAGVGVETRARLAGAWTSVPGTTVRAELAYLEQPNGGAFDVWVDGVRAARISTRASRTVSAFRTLDIPEAATHQIELRATGDGDVRVFGVSLEGRQAGVVFDALGINGARVGTCLQWKEDHWAEQLKHRAPSLVMFAYGTNESTDDNLTADAHERQWVELLGRFARAVPSASCLLMGPPDRAVRDGESWRTSSKLKEIIASQRRVAAAAGCAFYDQQRAMGGDGAVAAWADEESPRAQKDRVHLTRDGYSLMGRTFAKALLHAFDAWRENVGLEASR